MCYTISVYLFIVRALQIFLMYSAVTRVEEETACSFRVTGGMFSEDYRLVWKKYPIQNC